MKKSIMKLLFIILPIIILAGCDKEDTDCKFILNPVLDDLEVTLNGDSAHFEAEISMQGDYDIDGYGFVWSLWENPTIMVNQDQQILFNGKPPSGKFAIDVNYQFVLGHTYYVSAYLKSGTRYFYSKDVAFKITD